MKYVMSVFTLLCCYVLCGFNYTWEIDETPQGQESVSILQPIVVTLYDTPIEVPSYSVSLRLIKKYNIFLDSTWSPADAYKLYLTLESIPQYTLRSNDSQSYEERNIEPSIWKISDRHLHNDIDIEYKDQQKHVSIHRAALSYAHPLLAEIEGVRGKFFSKRLHRAMVRYVTDNGTHHYAVRRILNDRYNVSIDVPDYTELTKYTTGENAGRFSQFKSEELVALINMLEEYPSGMLKTPGLKYLVRRLDGTPHPLYPNAPAVAWTSAGYIEFMESAFKGQGLDYVHRLILHEKAHFLWAYLFDDQLKADWITLGGWYRNPDDKDGWSTTEQTTFVSAYAHGKNPNEDMAESISFYIVNPDKLRSRAPAKYEFIQNRIMHGTRYISQIREDLTFEVYNLYPDYVYPGRIVRIDIQVDGEPEEDKIITVELELHKESELDSASSAYIRVFSEKGTQFDLAWLEAYTLDGQRVQSGHILRGQYTLSKYAVGGYWSPDTIRTWDANGNERLGSQTDFGWKLYIDNPLADCDPPEYVPNSMQLSLSDEMTDQGQPYQMVTATCKIIEQTFVKESQASMNDTFAETYSSFSYGRYDQETQILTFQFAFPDYMPGGVYKMSNIRMRDVALNGANVYFTDDPNDEPPQTIKIKTTNPDFEKPVLDINRITIKATPTNPDAPNGETIVNITFYVKDNISGYTIGAMRLRDPHGVMHFFYHYPNTGGMYFPGDPTVYRQYQQTVTLPVGSVPGIWGLAEMGIRDKAGNHAHYDFTEIVRFSIKDESIAKTDVNADGETNIQDLVIVANAFEHHNAAADVNGDGTVNIQDLVIVANDF